MKGILLLNGEPYTGAIDCNGAVVYCCDGAYAWANGRVRIDKNIGDFDSLFVTPEPAPEEIFPSEKNYTDGEIALRKMIASGITKVDIYGGFGRREDHFLGNLQLLYYAHKNGVAARLISENTIAFADSGDIAFDGLENKTISVLPFGGDAHIMGSEGFKYEYPDKICYGECRGVSNIVKSKSACLHVRRADTVLVFINMGEV
ncbi:MAG: thiamine diphosphokinase [Clostridia bacterium]|nr:thiamine diphosphokinase [Clostridia bacterium]